MLQLFWLVCTLFVCTSFALEDESLINPDATIETADIAAEGPSLPEKQPEQSVPTVPDLVSSTTQPRAPEQEKKAAAGVAAQPITPLPVQPTVPTAAPKPLPMPKPDAIPTTTVKPTLPMPQQPALPQTQPVPAPMPVPEPQPAVIPLPPSGDVRIKPAELPAIPTETTQAPNGQQQPAQSPQEPETIGLDTINLTEPSGNWLYKRIWWEKAQDRYEKIKTLVDRVFESRMVFFNKRNELEHTVFDPFYIHSGLGRGELQELLTFIMDQMEQQRSREGTLTEAERAFMAIVNKEKETLEQLRLDIDGISKLDVAVDESLNKLMEQLNLARSYERKAWDNFKSIAQELSDTKAKELYYGMVNYEENIAAINNYIRKEFASYFDQLVKTAQDNVQRIQSAIKTLKEKGIDFKKKAQELEKQACPAERERLERERCQREKQEQEDESRTNSWTGWITGFFTSLWDGITGSISSVYDTIRGWFGGGSVPEEVIEVQETKEPEMPPATV